MKPSVVIILNRLVIGGQAVDTISLAYYLQQDFDIVILYGEKENDEIESSFLLQQYPGLNIQKIKSLRRTINPFTDLLAFYAIFQEIRKNRAQVVHTHGSKSGLLGRLAAWILKTPVIIHTFHGHLFHSYFSSIGNRLIKWVERKLAVISANIIALSTEQKRELTEKFAIARREKISIIPLGVDQEVLLSNADSNRSKFRNSFNLANDAIAVGSVGRIVPIKNQLLFLEVAKSVLVAGASNVHFFVVGDGESKKQMLNYLVANNLPYNDVGEYDTSKKIFFTSWMEDMATVYHGLDIVMLTSFNEGTPLSIIEAQFCGKPVVASNTGGVKDTFLPNGSGFLIDGYQPVDYIAALNKLIASDQLRKEMGHAAISFASNTFAKKHEVAAIKNLYLQQLAKTRN
jgi:glycosyltransferase involved in cell wall biosynthesis